MATDGLVAAPARTRGDRSSSSSLGLAGGMAPGCHARWQLRLEFERWREKSVPVLFRCGHGGAPSVLEGVFRGCGYWTERA